MLDSGSDGHAQSEYYVVMVGLAPDFCRLVSGIQICLPAEVLKFVSEFKQTADTYIHVSPTMHREAALCLNHFLSEHLK